MGFTQGCSKIHLLVEESRSRNGCGSDEVVYIKGNNISKNGWHRWWLLSDLKCTTFW